ncbi:MAG: response regulator transcription factor [Pseudomonadota bacterium]
MAREAILVVEDERDILDLLKYNLSKEGYRVECVTTGEEGFSLAKTDLPDLVLLDLMLPGMDGLDVCRLLKSDTRTAHIPVIMLTAKSEDIDIVTGLELGANDYITKPFSPRVVIARIRAVLRKRNMHAPEDRSVVKIHDLLINPGRHEVLVKNRPVELTATEFGILSFLCRNPGLVFTRTQIINAVKGDDYPVTDRSVDVQIAGLRKKLGTAGSCLETVRGVGYRFKE